MARDTATNFDVDLFKKRIRLLDSDQGDGGVAYTQALKQCRERTPPILLHEAVTRYMSPPRPSMDQVEEENKRLEQENAQLRQEILALAAKQREDRMEDEEHNFGELVDRVYGTPEGRIVAVLALFAARLGIYLKWEDGVRPLLFWVISIAFLIPAMMVLLDWVALQYRRSGLFIFLLRAGMIGTGLVETFHCLFNLMPWEVGFEIASYPSNIAINCDWAFAILALTAAVACSKVASFIRLCFIAFVLPMKPIQVVKGMF